MERQNFLIVLNSIICGIYFITLVGSRCIFNAFYMKWGAKLIIFGSNTIIFGAFFIIFGAFSIIGSNGNIFLRLSSWSSPVSHVAVEFASRLEEARKAQHAILTLRLTFSDIGPIQINFWRLESRMSKIR